MPWLSLIAVIVSFCGGIVLGMTIVWQRVAAWRRAQLSLIETMREFHACSRHNSEDIRRMLVEHDTWRQLVTEQAADYVATIRSIRDTCIKMKDRHGQYLDSERLMREVESECSEAIQRSTKRNDEFNRLLARRKAERYHNRR